MQPGEMNCHSSTADISQCVFECVCLHAADIKALRQKHKANSLVIIKYNLLV